MYMRVYTCILFSPLLPDDYILACGWSIKQSTSSLFKFPSPNVTIHLYMQYIFHFNELPQQSLLMETQLGPSQAQHQNVNAVSGFRSNVLSYSAYILKP